MPPLVLMKTTCKEELRLSPSNYIMLARGQLTTTYEVLEKIGEGGYGTVWRARHKPSGQLRAVKTLLKQGLDEEQREEMLTEVGVLRTLDHPNILKVFEVIEDDTSLHIVSELCTGGDLFESVVRAGRIDEHVVAGYMQQILSAVAYCHERGIVHRDLKPENLLLETNTPDAHLKVIDFGTSSRVMPRKHLKGVVGTSYYMAPEVLVGRYNEKCDIWSCGVVMYIFLGGTPPFPGQSDKEIEANIERAQVSFESEEWVDVSEEARAFILRMLTKSQVLRPSAYELLQDPWLLSAVDAAHVDKGLRKKVLERLRNFHYGCRLREAALQYIAWQLAPVEATESLRSVFLSLDADRDGRLSAEDLEKGFGQLFPGGDQDIRSILRSMDGDGSGYVDYHEFLAAAMNWRQVLTTEVMESAFTAFDKDGNGTIELDEVRFMLQGEDEVEAAVWTDLLHDADSDGNGVVSSTQIDFAEFQKMMKRASFELSKSRA